MYAWNSISKRGFRSSIPRTIAREIRERAAQEELASGTATLQSQHTLRSVPYPGSLAAPSSVRTLPKGCYCQLGSVFRAIIFLTLILGVTAGLVYWIYTAHFVSTSDETLTSRSNKTANITSNLFVGSKIEPKNANDFKTLEETALQLDKDVRLYIDYEGKLHQLSELTEKLLKDKTIKLPKEFEPLTSESSLTTQSSITTTSRTTSTTESTTTAMLDTTTTFEELTVEETTTFKRSTKPEKVMVITPEATETTPTTTESSEPDDVDDDLPLDRKQPRETTSEPHQEWDITTTEQSETTTAERSETTTTDQPEATTTDSTEEEEATTIQVENDLNVEKIDETPRTSADKLGILTTEAFFFSNEIIETSTESQPFDIFAIPATTEKLFESGRVNLQIVSIVFVR